MPTAEGDRQLYNQKSILSEMVDKGALHLLLVAYRCFPRLQGQPRVHKTSILLKGITLSGLVDGHF